jgi:histidinol dehydrogenase
LLHACKTAGATEVYRLGGAQAIAAMAYGTQFIPKTQKVFGPGNAYVVAAKRLLFGYVAIDLLPGPSEVLILADDSARAKFIAADLLAQAEHGSGHERTWFITTSPDLIPAVESELAHQLPLLTRHEHIQKALLANCWFIQVKAMPDGIQLVNQLAPEHCEIMTRNPASLAKEITTAGAICLGNYTPNVLGDYVAGPSHVLPTGGAGNSFPGLTVDRFQRRSSVIQYDRTALTKSFSVIKAFADVEGLDAHAQSAAIRLESQ